MISVVAIFICGSIEYVPGTEAYPVNKAGAIVLNQTVETIDITWLMQLLVTETKL